MSIHGFNSPGDDERPRAPGAEELEQMCDRAKQVARFCEELEPMVDLRIPTERSIAYAVDLATDENDEPYIWDLDL